MDDFARNYRAEDAIEWYTKDTFVYRLLNAALRRYNIEVLFLFGFLIKDIQNQLKKEHKKFILTHHNKIVKVYRGQMMTPEEVQQLKNNRRTPWLVNNSFFSTTFNRDVALRFLDQSPSQTDDGLQSVLFEIEINTEIKSRSYSDVSQMSQFEEETEFLFTFGNRFGKTIMFYNDCEYIYIVQLQLNYDHHIKDDQDFVFDNQRKMLKKCVHLLESVIDEISSESTNVILNELINLYPAEKQWILALKMSWLALKFIKEKDYLGAVFYYKKSLDIWHEFIDDESLNCLINIAGIHQNLARCYQDHIKNEILAEKEYLEAIQYFKLGLKKAKSHYERMKIYEKLSYLEKHRMKLIGYDPYDTEMILRYEELGIANMLELYHDDQAQLGQAFEQLAELRKFQFQFDESLVNYQRALDIYLQQPLEFSFYLNISYVINEIVKIYIEEKHGDYSSAIKYQLIKYNFILKHFKYVGIISRQARCIN